MYSASMNGSLIATTWQPPFSKAALITRRPMRPKLQRRSRSSQVRRVPVDSNLDHHLVSLLADPPQPDNDDLPLQV